ncbi:TPA: imidazoleglycerol-phosphate dehydratase HisB [Candidatus Woesearchaeota archaeon]|nr:imidazoleglycerol-phosphate dehydratase HisB [Candidatus Woesearchaeota archaeon]HIH49032.1 imidazoleglycerol-phosphate dehydratase HisB [Candidatus Woesearchaeota archaeon]HIJ03035.1 imidazoleglycerol-phosphate dehydratase HisB [Candidatus Woesearchaeota archaeon]
MRSSIIERKTNETEIRVKLNLDGSGLRNINVPIGFLSHMLDLFAKHGSFDLELDAKGDTWIDEHHTIEDTGIVIGQAFREAVGAKNGIKRFAAAIIPMDEVLALVSIDLSGRYAFNFTPSFSREKVGDFPTELMQDFFDAFAQNLQCSLHIILLSPGRNDHHRIEAIFKAFGRALREACSIDETLKDAIPSTKGIL